jgi:hypothetical protein
MDLHQVKSGVYCIGCIIITQQMREDMQKQRANEPQL